MKPFTIKKFLPLFILVAAVVIAVAMVAARPNHIKRNSDIPPPKVNVLDVKIGSAPVRIIVHGNVSAWRELDLAAEVTGRVVWVSPDFEEGKAITAGAVLLRVDDTDYKLALAEAKASLASAELALADAKALKRTAAIGEARANVLASKERITKAERDLANTEVKAPYNAIIDSHPVELGEYVTTGKTVARILGSDKAEIRLPVISADIGFLDPEEKRDVVVSAFLGQDEYQWIGKLSTIQARMDEQARVFPVVVTVPEPLNMDKHGQALSFGLFVKTEIPGTPVEQAVVVPHSALHNGGLVYLFNDGHLQSRKVHVVRSDSYGVVINEGLEEGDQVVVTRLDLMFDGMSVAKLDG